MHTDLRTYPEGLTDRWKALDGLDVRASDGGVGKIDKATEEVGTSYVVVDTGPRLFGKKVLIPTGWVARLDLDSQTVHLSLTREQVQRSPEYDESTMGLDATCQGRLDAYYAAFGE